MQPALSNNGSLNKNIFGNTNSGIIGSINNATGLNQSPPVSSPQTSTVNQSYPTGNIAGYFGSTQSKPDTTYTHTTTTTSPTGSTTVAKPIPNESVKEQQQMLNDKYGAGLVVD